MKLYGKMMCGFLTAAMLAGGLSSCGDADLLTYRYDYDLTQYIDLAPYTGLDAKAYRIDITEEKVQNEVFTTLSYYSKLTTVTDRGAALGDTVYVDYIGTCEGEEIENETDSELTLGTYVMPEEFENAIVGHTAGDVISLDMTFATPYEPAPEYSGKEAHFEITLHEICEQELPVYNDTFVQGYLGHDSVAEYEAAVHDKLYKYYNDTLTQYIVSQTWAQVVENTTVKEYPKKELEDVYNQIIHTNTTYAESHGIEFKNFVTVYYDMTEEEFYDWVQEQAEAIVKEDMISYAIARAENITLTEEEYTERATEYAIEQYELASLEAFELLYEKNVIRERLLFDKVRERIAEKANRIDMADSGDTN